MKEMTLQEHTTALFVIAVYYWLDGDNLNASSALEVAVRVSESGSPRYA